MRNLRFLISLGLLTILVLFNASFAFAADTYTSGSIHYTVDASGNATITEYDSGEENVVIPSTIDGHPIVAIGARAFYGDTVIKTVSLPEGLTSIGDRAFDSCSKIEELNIPSTVRTLGTSSFTHLKITELTLPEGITEIPYHCFAYCNSLTDVYLPSTLKKIGGYAFKDCGTLKNIDLPEGLTTIDEYAFDNCYQVNWETLPDGIETVNYATLYYVNPASGVFTFSKNVKTIKEYHFYKVTELAFNGYKAPSASNLSLSKEYTIHIREGATGFNTKPWTNANIIEDIQPCSPHAWDGGKVIKQATCSTEGEKLLTCNVCGLTKNEVVPKVDHSWNTTPTVDKPATCEEEGSQSIHCKYCDAKTDVEVLPAKGHDMVHYDAEPATCLESGHEAYDACSRCDYKTELVEIPALGHTWKHYKQAAGLLKNGSEYDQCTVCKTKKNVKTLTGYATYYVKSFKVAKAKKAFTAKWTKQSAANQKKFNGYQIRYSLKSNMSGAKYATAAKSSKSKKISKLKSKKKYYVQVRTYTKKNGKTFYSKWSAKKSVKTK